MAQNPDNKPIMPRAELTGDICREIVTLANTYGGELLIGVTNGGYVTGVADPQDVIKRLGEMVRDYIRPDLTAFVSCEVREIEEKQVVAVTVRKGEQRPYNLAFFGFYRSGGVADIIAPQEHYLDFCGMFKHAGLSFPLSR
ncbi:MAG: ATP-binding protein [Oscillospiraceae bacterium]|nr:ATP-binding protein [Oscillospiraceae bacterium]